MNIQETQTKMLKKLKKPVTYVYDYNPVSLEVKNFEKAYPEKVFFTLTEDGEVNNFEIANADHSKVQSQKVTSHKASTRTVPNILNRRKISETAPTETDTVFTNTERNTEILFNLATMDRSVLESKSTKKEGKRKQLSHSRKQQHRFNDKMCKLPHWHASFVNNEQELNINLSTEPKNTKEKKLKLRPRKYNKKRETSVAKVDQKKESSVSDLARKDSLPKFQALCPLQEMEYKNLQDQVDFSTNEIFSKYNYEFYVSDKLDCFTDCVVDSDDTHNSLSTVYEDDIYEREYDINGNELDVYNVAYCSPKNDRNKGTAPSNQSACLEYWDKDVLLLSNEELNCYDYCLEGCASNSTKTGGVRNYPVTKDKVLTETVRENSSGTIYNTNYQAHFEYVDLYNTNTVANSANSIVEEDDTCLTIDTDTLPQYVCQNIEVPIAEARTFHDKKDAERNVFVESGSAFESNDSDIVLDLDELNYVLDIYEEQMKDSNGNIVQKPTKKCDKNTKEFQCLLCPLTFSSARTMALHEAAAHGGTYVILCESCGRLFNRKCHFNRHFVHCGRLKDRYKCDTCMKTYRHKSSLVHHLKVVHHTGHYTFNRSTTFTCSVCEKVYSKFGAFENHVKRHKEDMCYVREDERKCETSFW